MFCSGRWLRWFPKLLHYKLLVLRRYTWKGGGGPIIGWIGIVHGESFQCSDRCDTIKFQLDCFWYLCEIPFPWWISMIPKIYEYGEVWFKIMHNPFMGYIFGYYFSKSFFKPLMMGTYIWYIDPKTQGDTCCSAKQLHCRAVYEA